MRIKDVNQHAEMNSRGIFTFLDLLSFKLHFFLMFRLSHSVFVRKFLPPASDSFPMLHMNVVNGRNKAHITS